MGEPQIPDAAVEVAAKAVHATDRLEWLGEPDWADLSAEDADSYRVYARKILAAAYPHLAAQVLPTLTHEYTWRHHQFIGLAEATTDRAVAERRVARWRADSPGCDVALVTRAVATRAEADWHDVVEPVDPEEDTRKIRVHTMPTPNGDKP